jgi:ubiquinone/menaquinone biosynthesis C-methylase UbiE
MDAPLLDTVAAAALALVTPASDARVLDVEAGLGALTLLLARHAARVDALDGSKAIVSALRARLAVARLGNVEARVADAAALPFPERTFDAGYFLSVVAAPSRATALAELRRVLKPGAPAVVAAASAAERDELIEDLVVAGFDEILAHAIGRTSAWLVAAVA